MKEAIAARRERGARIGSPVYNRTRRFPPGCQGASAIVRKARSEARAWDLAPLVWRAVGEGKSMAVIAEEFNQSGIAPRADAPWSKNSIWRITRQTVDEFVQRPVGARGSGPLRTKYDGASTRSARFCSHGGEKERPTARLQPSSGCAVSALHGEVSGDPRQLGVISCAR
jgi:hypothetical protein